jgi:DNA-binding GntR family transcriptional regulator
VKPLKTIFFVPVVPTGRGSDCTKADVAVSITPAFGKIGNFDHVDKVAHRITGDIVLEQLGPREKLPNELSRCAQPGVSRSVLRKAVVQILVSKGLLERR